MNGAERFLLSLLVVTSACASERWVVAEVEVPPSRGAVCVVARGPAGTAFARSFPADDASGSLTFVEGDAVSDSVALHAFLTRGGRLVAETRVTASFGVDGLPVRLRPGECAPAPPPGARTLATLAGAQGLVAVDVDGDGLDEVIVDVGGSARDLAGATFPFESLVGAADLNGDCRFEPLGIAGGAVVDGAALSVPVTGDAVAAGDAGEGPRLFVAGSMGVAAVGLDGGTRALSGAPSRAVAVGDLNGDGIDEVVVGGDSGIEVFFGGDGGPVIAPGATPRGWTARSLALGDIDGDGDLDLVVARASALGLALNRGDGFLEAVAVPAVAPVAVVVGDVDGDCLADVVVVGGAGATSQWFGGTAAGTLGGAAPLGDDVVGATFARLEPAGAQLVTLHADGRVEAR